MSKVESHSLPSYEDAPVPLTYDGEEVNFWSSLVEYSHNWRLHLRDSNDLWATLSGSLIQMDCRPDKGPQEMNDNIISLIDRIHANNKAMADMSKDFYTGLRELNAAINSAMQDPPLRPLHEKDEPVSKDE